MDFNKSHYELLGLEAHAPASQVERAYRFVKQVYSDPVLSAQMGAPEELETYRARIDEAYRVLSDPATRLDYDAGHDPRGGLPPKLNGAESEHAAAKSHVEPRKARRPRRGKAPKPLRRATHSDGVPTGEIAAPPDAPGDPVAAPEPKSAAEATVPVAPPIVPTARLPAVRSVAVPQGPFNGATLRSYRMARGISLDQIADETKVRKHYLENIEADRFDAFPAALYLKGYLQAYCRALGLDCRAVADSYMSRVSFEPPPFRLPTSSFFRT